MKKRKKKRTIIIYSTALTDETYSYTKWLSGDPNGGNSNDVGCYLGINGISDLPPLADFVPGADVVEALEGGLRPDQYDENTESKVSDKEAGLSNDDSSLG